MKKADFQTNSLASLRDSALQVLSQQQAQRPGGNRLEADVRKQLHELQVNQIELEMQNSALAEMNQSMGEVEAGLARYTDLYDFAPMGYCTVDRAGMLQDVNLTAAALLGLSRQKLVGLDLESFVVTTYKTVYTSFMADVFDGATGQFCEVVLKNKDRRAMFVRIEANTNPTSQTCRVILKDISARKSAENALREANDALERRVKERTAEVESANHFLRYQIEEHKRTVESLRFSREALRKLAAHQELIKEEERKRIAREIHDELGGLLTSIKANASVAISRKGRNGTELNQYLNDISSLADTAIDTMRRVIADLRPSVLDQLGVLAALEWYVDKIAQRTGLKCSCLIDPAAAALEVNPERSTALFRTVQEALTNVVRHAEATSVAVRVHCDDDVIVAEVEDNGKGMDVVRTLNRQSWGIDGMHERARHFGGDLEITSTFKNGTRVLLRLPLHTPLGTPLEDPLEE